MDKARLIEILSREHNKLQKGGVEWLREYASNAQRDLGFTFYMACRGIAQSSHDRVESTYVQNQVNKYLSDNRVHFLEGWWNPINWFTARWTMFEKTGAEYHGTAGPIHPEKQFDPEYTKIVERDKNVSPQLLWLAEPYADEVRRFFGQHVKEPIVHDEALPKSKESPLTALGRELLWNPPDRMEKVAKLLSDEKKRQLIFYGPPGTGKTFVARALAKHLMEGEEPTFLQFHPSYSYEDFFEGYRPVPCQNGGMPQFKLVPGPLKELAEHARQHPEKPHVLAIDEINRGNLAKIFGELYFLLEYRDQKTMLQYGGQPFSLPKNLLIIGTMNTADRSISHIDAALRRRFHFFPLFPDEEPIKGLLARYLAKEHKDKLLDVAQVVDRANQQLNHRHGSIGHSYFMRHDLNESWVELIWDYSIMPLIEDRFIDQPEKLEQFKLDVLRREPQLGRVSEPA